MNSNNIRLLFTSLPMPDTKEIIDYKIIYSTDDCQFTTEVTTAILEWWQPLWGVSVSSRYCQAMVKYKKKEKPITLNADKIKACADELEKAYLYRV